jgi:glycerophosphoryl diester phosphodiesterase
MTLAELKKLDAAAQFTLDDGKTYPFRGKGFTVPTLREVFDALPNNIFNIEPKRQGVEIAEPLCSLIREKNFANKVIVGSFTQSIIDDTRKACPEVATSAAPGEAISFFLREFGGIERSYSPPMQALQVPKAIGGMDIVTRDFVDAAHERNLKVHVWTINSTDEMQRLIDLGVDGIITDYPDELLKLLNRK